MTREVFVDDAIRAIETISREPVALIGHSMGGNVAYRVAARRRDLVRELIVSEAQAWGQDPGRSASTISWLKSWPTPFPTIRAASLWFKTQGLVAEAWQENLELRADGWHPVFDMNDMLRIEAAPQPDDRKLWSSLSVRTTVVAGEQSSLTSKSILVEMADAINAKFVEIDGAGHDVHLDRPEAWNEMLLGVLESADLLGRDG